MQGGILWSCTYKRMKRLVSKAVRRAPFNALYSTRLVQLQLSSTVIECYHQLMALWWLWDDLLWTRAKSPKCLLPLTVTLAGILSNEAKDQWVWRLTHSFLPFSHGDMVPAEPGGSTLMGQHRNLALLLYVVSICDFYHD